MSQLYTIPKSVWLLRVGELVQGDWGLMDSGVSNSHPRILCSSHNDILDITSPTYEAGMLCGVETLAVWDD